MLPARIVPYIATTSARYRPSAVSTTCTMPVGMTTSP